jgi:hypothetical protein
MCELNPIEIAWSKVKRSVRESNITGEIFLAAVRELTHRATSSVTKEHWLGYCAHICNTEAEYWEKDGLMEDVTDRQFHNLFGK